MNDLFIQGISLHWDKVGKDSYLREIAAFQGLDQIRFNKPVTFFAGENGSGKSTLLEAIAVAHGFNPEGGTRNYNFSTRDTHSELCDAITVAKGYRRERWGYFLRAESFYNVATQEEQYADAAHPSALYHEKSHGESFLQLAQNNLRGDGLYFFDEPEAALSPQRQLTLLAEIYECAKAGRSSSSLPIPPYCWVFQMRIFTALTETGFTCAIMRKRAAIRLQKCSSITGRHCCAIS